ncbi:MAG: outer membrane protein transport protein [Oligoflexus sp.]|nr:outer membrane protein transport protein [Oligoflexus sp.]
MQLRNASRLLSVSVLGLGGLVWTNAVFAAGFALRNHSASGVGTSLASDTVNTFDASGLLSNPAIMSAFKGNHLSLNINYTDANIKAKDATLALATGAPNPVQGGNSEDNVSDPIAIPSLYGIYQISDDVHVGFSFNVPYGTNTQYQDTWTGRYYGTKTSLKAYDVGLHGSYKISDMFAVGLTLDWQQAKGELASAVDLGFVNYAVTAQRAQAQAAAGVITPAQAGAAVAAAAQGIGRADAITTYKGDSTAFAWGLGFLLKPVEGAKIGLSYRAAVHHEAKGDITWGPTNNTATAILTGLRAAGAAGARFNDNNDAKLKLDLPAVTSLGYSQDMGDFTGYANITHSAWSTLAELSPEWAGQKSVTNLNWKNSVYYAIGGDYRLAPEWTLRAGLGHDQSVTDKDHRTPRTPDGNRVAVSVGASYKVGAFDLSLAYQQLFLKDTESNLKATDHADNATRGTYTAKYTINPSIAVVSAGYAF